MNTTAILLLDTYIFYICELWMLSGSVPMSDGEFPELAVQVKTVHMDS